MRREMSSSLSSGMTMYKFKDFKIGKKFKEKKSLPKKIQSFKVEAIRE